MRDSVLAASYRAILGGFLMGKWGRFTQEARRVGPKYKPHQGRGECERRRTQILFGELNPENRGTVLTADERVTL